MRCKVQSCLFWACLFTLEVLELGCNMLGHCCDSCEGVAIKRCTRSRWMQRRSRNLAQTDSRSMSRRRSETARSLRLMRARQNHL
eukprot:5303340-Amphidinium_carterae.1